MMRRLLWLLALMTLPVVAGAQVRVCIEPADTTVSLGDVITVRVTTDGPVADLKGYLVRATHNTAVLTHLSTTPGSVLNGYLATFLPHAAAPDTIGFDAAVLIGATMGPGTLGYFTFTASAPGICDLVITDAKMRNSLNQPFPIITCNGRVRVVGPLPVRNSTWSTVKARP